MALHGDHAGGQAAPGDRVRVVRVEKIPAADGRPAGVRQAWRLVLSCDHGVVVEGRRAPTRRIEFCLDCLADRLASLESTDAVDGAR